MHCCLLQPMAEPEPCVSHRVPQSPSCGFDLAAWLCIMSTSCAHRMHSVSDWQTAVALVLHTCEFGCRMWNSCRLTRSLDLCLSPQGFDDQPGVEPQRLLSAQCRHHLLQPVAVQLDDLQVETGSWGLQSPCPPHCPYHPHRSQLSSRPSSSSLDFCTAGLCGTDACLHKQQTNNYKKIWGKKKKKTRDCVQFKGLIFAQRSYIFRAWHLCWAAVRIRTLAECVFVSCLMPGGKVKGREMNCDAFVALETERSNILILGATGPDEHTGGAVTYMHLHLHPHIQYWDDTYLILVCWLKNWMCCYIQTPPHTQIHVWWHAKIYRVCHITRGVCSIWWIVYRSGVCGRGKLFTRPGSNITCKCCVFQTAWSYRFGWSLLNHDDADGVSKAASWRESNNQMFPPDCVSFLSFILLSNVANATRLSHEGFITPWKAFEYLTRVWLLAK